MHCMSNGEDVNALIIKTRFAKDKKIKVMAFIRKKKFRKT